MPSSSSICGDPGAARQSLTRILLAVSSSGWVFRRAKTHRPAARSSSRRRDLAGAQPVRIADHPG